MLPVQTFVPPVTAPPTEAAFTVTKVGTEVVTEQVPLCTTALNWVDCVKATEVYVVAILGLETALQVVNGDTEFSHLTTLPTLPARVKLPLVLPLQIVVPPVTAPPTEVGSTVTVVGVEVAVEHAPLWTTALNCVVWVKAPDV